MKGSGKNGENVARDLLKEISEKREEDAKSKMEINAISEAEDVRAFVREELSYIGNVLHEKYGLSVPAIRRLVLEVSSVTY